MNFANMIMSFGCDNNDAAIAKQLIEIYVRNLSDSGTFDECEGFNEAYLHDYLENGFMQAEVADLLADSMTEILNSLVEAVCKCKCSTESITYAKGSKRTIQSFTVKVE